MLRMTWLVIVVNVIAASATPAPGVDAPEAETPTTRPANPHDRLLANYMAGKWDDASAELIEQTKAISTMSAAQKSDIDYIRRAISEGRPAWWKLCKPGKKTHFRPIIWGQTLNCTFDPDLKNNVQINYVNGVASVIISWKAADMDDPDDLGELKFTKGERAHLDIFSNLGFAQSWADVPPHPQLNMDDKARQELSRYLNFRGNVTGAYYATPRARRLAIWLAISGWSDEYAKLPSVNAQKALGVMFLEEVLSHPQTYPSIPKPQKPPADGAESKIVWELQDHIRKNDLTFAEDCALRDAIKAFATTNAGKVRTTSLITLPSGQKISLDPTEDKKLAAARDAWIIDQY